MKLFILLILVCSIVTGNAMASEKKIYGYVEKVILLDKALTVSAKLDTGAKSSSLSAVNIHKLEKDGKTYLRFTVPTKDARVEFEAEYIGRVKIKVRAGEHKTLTKAEPIRRPVVLIRMQMGMNVQTIHVNLTNRKRFLYPLLLGRDAIKTFSGLVDPSLVFTLRSNEEVVSHEVK